jgi:hypothetical protein
VTYQDLVAIAAALICGVWVTARWLRPFYARRQGCGGRDRLEGDSPLLTIEEFVPDSVAGGGGEARR